MNKQLAGFQMAFWARKSFGTFEKRGQHDLSKCQCHEQLFLPESSTDWPVNIFTVAMTGSEQLLYVFM